MNVITTHDITLGKFIKESAKNAIILYFSPLIIIFSEVQTWFNLLKKLRDIGIESSQEQVQQIVAVTDELREEINKLRQESDRAVQVLRSLEGKVEESAKRQTRIGLSQTYIIYSAESISSENIANRTRQLFYKQYTSNQFELIQTMFALLNALHEEWSLSNEKVHAEEAFKSTLKSFMEPFARNTQSDPEIRFLIDDFEKIFVDFPDEFKRTILSCIKNAPLN